MKTLKNLSLLFVLMFAVSFAGFSQVDDEEAQMFGSKRGSEAAVATFDFGKINNDIVEHEFTIRNTSVAADLIISEFVIPEGVGIVVVDQVVKPKSEGKFIATVNKKYIDEKGKFSKKIIVKTIQEKPKGVKVISENTYIIKGEK